MEDKSRLLQITEGSQDILIDENTIELDFSDMPTREEAKATIRPRFTLMHPINAYTLEGEYLATYRYLAEAARAENVTNELISCVCRGRRLFSTKYHKIWLYAEDDINDRLELIEAKRKRGKSIRPVNEYSLTGKFLFQYPSLKLAARINGVSTQKMTKCCRGVIPHLNKRIFLYSEDNIKDRIPAVKEALFIERTRRKKCRPVNEYTLDGQFVRSFISCSEAAREYGMHVSQIARCCQGTDGRKRNILQTHGKIFLYTGDSISVRLELINSLKTDKYVR